LKAPRDNARFNEKSMEEIAKSNTQQGK